MGTLREEVKRMGKAEKEYKAEIARLRAEVKLERAMCDGFKELAYHRGSCTVMRVWSDKSDKCTCGYDDLAANHRKARGL